MMTDRVSPFDEFDISGFAPVQEQKGDLPPPAAVREVSERANFPSREGTKARKAESLAREPRRHRTGRNAQFSIKARPETIDDFYKIAELEGWVLGETLEKAVGALKLELAAHRKSKT